MCSWGDMGSSCASSWGEGGSSWDEGSSSSGSCPWDETDSSPVSSWDEVSSSSTSSWEAAGEQEKAHMKVPWDPYAWNSHDVDAVWTNNRGLSMKVYQRGRQIGAGNARVYKVLRVADRKIFAGKVTPFKGELKAETDMLRSLQHEHILQVVDLYSEPGAPSSEIMISEFCAYGSIQKKLDSADRDESQRFGIMDMLDITEQVAEALAYIHGKGLYHSDIKAGNIFIRQKSPRFDVVLGDCAEVFPTPAEIKPQSQVRGTKLYFSPEMVGLEANTGPKDDIWALGMTLLEMMAQWPEASVSEGPSGERQQTREARKEKAMAEFPRKAALHVLELLRLNPHNQVVQLVAKMLDLEAEKRPTADAVADEARNIMRGYTVKEIQERGNANAMRLSLNVPEGFVRHSRW